MITVVDTDRLDSAGLAIHCVPLHLPIPRNQWFPNFQWSDAFRPGWMMDRLFDNVGLDFPICHASAYNLVGVKSPMGDLSCIIGDFKPETSRGYDWMSDWRYHGNIAAALLCFGRDSNPAATSWSNENEVRHTGARGSLRLSGKNRHIFPNRVPIVLGKDGHVGEYRHDAYSPDRLFTKLHFTWPGGMDSFGLRIPASRTDLKVNGHRRFTIDDLVSQLKGQEVHLTIDFNYGKNELSYWNFSYDGEERQHGGWSRFSYYFKNWASCPHPFADEGKTPILGVDVYRVSIEIDANVSFNTPYSRPVGWGVDVDLRDYTTQSYTFKRYYELISHLASLPQPSGYPYPFESGYANEGPQISTVHILETGGTSYGSEPAFLDKPTYISGYYAPEKSTIAFRQFVESIHRDIAPACALSANECLKSYSSNSNFLESLPELPQILRGIKDASRFAHSLKKLAKGDPDAVEEIIDLIAGGILYVKYGLKPLASDVREAKDIARTYYEEMGVISAGLPRVLYGRFDYKIPEKVPGIPGELEVTVRTKMVLRSNPAGILAWIITLDDVGLFPTMARVWDLVPFSFVVDWFTGLSQKFEAIDNNAIRLALDVDYYTHSYEYRLNLHPEFYSPYRRSGTSKPHLRVYIREKSLIHPLIRSEKYDFLPPRGVRKNLLSAGALLWVLK